MLVYFSVSDVTIATDLICGFPTETEADFEETMQLVRDYKFPSLFINQFFPRPGTPAAKMPKIPAQNVGCLCLGFYGRVNPLGTCREHSVYLTTLFPGQA